MNHVGRTFLSDKNPVGLSIIPFNASRSRRGGSIHDLSKGARRRDCDSGCVGFAGVVPWSTKVSFRYDNKRLVARGHHIRGACRDCRVNVRDEIRSAFGWSALAPRLPVNPVILSGGIRFAGESDSAVERPAARLPLSSRSKAFSGYSDELSLPPQFANLVSTSRVGHRHTACPEHGNAGSRLL